MRTIIEPHTLKRALERGASENEILEVMEKGSSIKAKNDRFSKELVFDFKNIWNDKYYEQKKIEVIYTIEDDLIITITVYVFYGKWE